MKKFLTDLWDLIYQIILWFALIIAFFVGLFLMGFTFRFISNVFMAGYQFL
jgi:hypothetical protein